MASRTGGSASHNHSVSTGGTNPMGVMDGPWAHNSASGTALWQGMSITLGNTGGSETRPKKINVLYCVKV